MYCLFKYRWIKIQRRQIPDLPGVMSYYLRLATRAAIRTGQVRYCQYVNDVEPGMWSGGIVGLKSILGLKSAEKALNTLRALSDLDLITYEYNRENKQLSYMISGYVQSKPQSAQKDSPIYAYNNCGFIRLPRNLTEHLVKHDYVFGEADAWLDLWCHTVNEDADNVFSHLAPCVQFTRVSATVTLDYLKDRWRWSKAKVYRFLNRHRGVFCLKKLPGSFGCLIFNLAYAENSSEEPSSEQIESLCRKLKRNCRNCRKRMTDRAFFCALVLRFSRKLLTAFISKNRVSLIYNRAYSSLMNGRNKEHLLDCRRTIYMAIGKAVCIESKKEARIESRTSSDGGSPGVFGFNIGSAAEIFEEVFGWRAPE